MGLFFRCSEFRNLKYVKNNESKDLIGQNIPNNPETKYTFHIAIKMTQEINGCIVYAIMFPQTI